jgi:hypothetical protein
MIEHQDGPVAFSALDGAEKARCPGADDKDVFVRIAKIGRH